MSRILCPTLAGRVVAAEEAAAQSAPGDAVGVSGFFGAGYPEAVPGARPHARHTPRLLDEALSWHQRYLDTGSMA
jgi:acyl-CoA hydrolase